MNNLKGKVFNRLTVIEAIDKRSNGGHIRWLCKCECGNSVEVVGYNLRRGQTKSCGCIKADGLNRIDITGQQFDRLVAIRATDKRSGTNIVWKCKCSCGNLTYISSAHLRDGTTKSCGCYRREVASKKASLQAGENNSFYKHGDTINRNQIPPYPSWVGIWQRTGNPKNPFFKRYGGRGIKVCDRWKDYVVFKADAIESGWKPGLTIDRIDSSGNYEPENCQWITRSENSKKARAENTR